MKKEDRDNIKRALDYNWPEIQRHLLEKTAQEASEETGEARDPYEPYWTTDADGNRTLHMSPDAWWLKDFKREHVILEMPGFVFMNTKPWHAGGVSSLIRQVYGLRDSESCDDCFSEDDVLTHIKRFPLGQFIGMRSGGMGAGHVSALAITMRTSRPPTAPALPWREAIGDMTLSAHEEHGGWLYGAEMAVRDMYRRQGFGSALYRLRFELVKYLNLCGMYAVGMLMGYRAYVDKMSVQDYGEKVIAGDIIDPTVTMQMNRGFRAEKVVTDYCEEPAAGNAGVLIVWDNPEYQPRAGDE